MTASFSRKVFDRKTEIVSLLKDYIECCTIQGVHFIFSEKLNLAGNIFWILVVSVMLVLSCYGSFETYRDWQASPVINTVMSTGLGIEQIDFPSVTICAQGSNDDMFHAAILKLVFEFFEDNGLHVDLTPYQAGLALYRNLAELKPIFYDSHFPGISMDSKILSLAQLLTTSEPEIMIQSWTVSGSVMPSSLFGSPLPPPSVIKSDFLLDTIMNPELYQNFLNMSNGSISEYKTLFKHLDKTKSAGAILSILWYSKLPCFDVKGVTSEYDGQKGLLKHCEWRGQRVPCSAIFKTVFTDSGVCCAFNKKSGDEIFKSQHLPKFLKRKQDEDRAAAFQNSTAPDWLDSQNGLRTISGSMEGLYLVLDAHSDLLGGMTVNSDFEGFYGLIDDRGSYPKPRNRGFHIKPGHKNLIALKATRIDSDEDIRVLEPKARNCRYPDEREDLKMYKSYTQSNCILECALLDAREKLSLKSNVTCTPWNYPFIDSSEEFCDPWNAVELLAIMAKTQSTTGRDCSHCLPDCVSTLYHPIISVAPFRKCQNSNFGVSRFCDFQDRLSIEPNIWAKQVIDEYNSTSPMPNYISSLKSNIRTYAREPDIFPKMPKTYDAYERDIAVVQVFFESPTVFQFNRQLQQTWVSFLSSVGGLLGLCIGISLVSFIELVWFCVRISGAILRPFTTPKHKH